MKASGYQLPVSAVNAFYRIAGAAAAIWRLFYLHFAAITAAICQSPDAHPDPTRVAG